MKRYREPAFQERIDAAARARAEALAKLREKPPVDEADMTARAASQAIKDAATDEKRRLARQAASELKAAKQSARDLAALKKADQKPAPTDAERKAERDARYLARKSRASSS
ncbi:MAG TPA: DUF6481 family protein [Sphingobium sp.]